LISGGFCAQTLHDMLVARQTPAELLEHSDVELCAAARGVRALQAVPEQLKFLMILGVHAVLSANFLSMCLPQPLKLSPDTGFDFGCSAFSFCFTGGLLHTLEAPAEVICTSSQMY
jgi:hypothetical protein